MNGQQMVVCLSECNTDIPDSKQDLLSEERWLLHLIVRSTRKELPDVALRFE